MLACLVDFLLDFLFPKFCIGCNKIDTLLCKKCFKKLKPIDFKIKLDLSKIYLDKIYSAIEHEGLGSKLIHSYKYKRIKGLSLIAARIISYFIKTPRANLITYIPIHKKRHYERGFNQSELIAKELSRLWNIPYHPTLIRIKHSKAQAKISSRKERVIRMKNCFKISKNLVLNLEGKTCILVDDVCTTGSTLNECAKILKQAGVKKVIGVTVGYRV